MKRRRILRFACVAFVLWAGEALPAADAAEEAPGLQTIGGLTVYLGVLPAAIVQGHREDHPEAAMHGGVPSGRHAYHMIAAVFDAGTGERIEDADIQARVSPLGLAGVTRQLEPMAIAGTITYGNYFALDGSGGFLIHLTITHPPGAAPLHMEFTYDHRTR
jgi:hypothetical protein